MTAAIELFWGNIRGFMAWNLFLEFLHLSKKYGGKLNEYTLHPILKNHGVGVSLFA